MAIFKCKMCGGELNLENGFNICECEYCGTKQTVPKLDDDKRAQLYERANFFRRENDYDKAMGVYEIILSEDRTDFEAYWGIVLCRYGVEYVEDPRTHKRLPTINRAQYKSIFEDEDYISAIEFADNEQKDVLKAEATAINKIQQDILDISNKEEPFDVFICYKETDANGRRTLDSVYAQDIYNALTKEGYKVFFSRITLENKLGSAYEPYIFAALNSAKVMLVVGTAKEHFDAVWVKNEWSRFLGMIKEGKDKLLIPVYKDITPNDMPEEFSYLQGQDIDKIGYIQDIVHGIDKVIGTKAAVANGSGINLGNAEKLVKEMYDYLAQKEWDGALLASQKIQRADPDNAEAHLGNFLAKNKIKSKEALEKGKTILFDEDGDLNKYKLLCAPEEQVKFSKKRLSTKKAQKRCKRNASFCIFLSLIMTFAIDPFITAVNIQAQTGEDPAYIVGGTIVVALVMFVITRLLATFKMPPIVVNICLYISLAMLLVWAFMTFIPFLQFFFEAIGLPSF